MHVADISDIIAGRPEDEALRTLGIICGSLKKFDLVEVNLSDNALGAKGVEACRDVLLGDYIQVMCMEINLNTVSLVLLKSVQGY